MGGAFSKKLLTGDDADDVVLLSVAPHVDEHEARRLEELQAVRGLDGDPPPGEYWYLISTPWLLAWLKFASANKGETGVLPKHHINHSHAPIKGVPLGFY